MEKPSRAFLLVAMAIYLAVVGLLYPLYSPDYFSILQFDNHYQVLTRADLVVGRFASALAAYAASFVGLDPFETYPVYVAATALAVGLFLRRLYLRYLGLEPSLAMFSLFAFTFLFSGAMFDLLSFREVPHHALLVFAFACLYLVLEDMRDGWPRALLRVVVIVCLFASYQAAAVMLVVLAVLKAMFEVAGGMSAREVGKRLVGDAVIMLAGLCLYLVFKGAVERHAGIEMSRKFLDYRDSAAVMRRLDEHARAVLALFRTPGPVYQWSHVGAGLVIGLLGYAALAARAGRRGVLCIILAAALVLLLQDPLNLVVAEYWPVLRSSFYVALIPGLLVAFVYSSATAPIVRRSRDYVLAGMACLYAVAGSLILIDAYALRERDAALAQQIAAAVKADPVFADVKGARVTSNWGRMMRAHYPGITGLSFDFGAPLMAVSWSFEPYIKHETGIELKYLGAADCREDGEPALKLATRDGVLDVCF
jgi:hypothetical protein